ncbi:MAG TPA: hypothetical protein VFB29_12360 [Pseudolabrys sp.]|nr:hypothetical protein [Pseudolabrys sp.]
MRIVLIIASVAAFIFSAWSNMPSSAEYTDTAIDPGSLVTSTSNLQAEQFPAF